ncbi:hypothetical protein [uncultured Bacteroides sp.]|uniref:hypothetical protein n=1 Tax=uncultured Bacteroides sp. TaxID=162156 RepID=UPI002AAAACCE|nr:hypothetical protein [uncultured Bacteroides sp.]
MEAERIAEAMPLLEHRIIVIENRELFLESAIKTIFVNNREGHKETLTHLAKALNAMFDFRNIRSPEKSIDLKSLEIQLYSMEREMLEEKEI